jgi:hypothetical protein
MNEDREWFAAKHYGYGAGLPISWQGWGLLLSFVVLICAAGFLIQYTLIGYISVLVMLTVPFLLLVARTTRGGWRWRWGKED